MRAAAVTLLLLAGAPGPSPALPGGARWLGPASPAHPTRIATLAPSLTETVIALGAGEHLVGVSRYDDLPAVAGLPRLGGLLDPSPEAILAVKPDLLLVQPSPANREVIDRVAALGVPVLELTLASMADVIGAERAVGAACGLTGSGERLAKQLEAHLAQVSASVKALSRPRALVVYGWDPLVVAGPHSFADELLRAAGGENAASAAKASYATYSVESAAAARPDLIIDATYDQPMPDTLKRIPGFAGVRTVKPGSLALLHPGPRLAEGLDELVGMLHPEMH